MVNSTQVGPATDPQTDRQTTRQPDRQHRRVTCRDISTVFFIATHRNKVLCVCKLFLHSTLPGYRSAFPRPCQHSIFRKGDFNERHPKFEVLGPKRTLQSFDLFVGPPSRTSLGLQNKHKNRTAQGKLLGLHRDTGLCPQQTVFLILKFLLQRRNFSDFHL